MVYGQKYIYYNKKQQHYFITQKGVYHGFYKTLTEAIQARNQLLQNGTLTPKYRGRPIKNPQNRHLRHNSTGSWSIQKKIGDKVENFGTYKTLENARSERDYLESINWDYDNME